MITAVDLLEHLEAKLEAALVAGDEVLAARLEEVARFVREIAEAALVAGDALTLQEARRLAAKLGPFGFAAAAPAAVVQSEEERVPVRRTCPRCGQHFEGPAGPFDQVGTLFCGTCARELLQGIRL